MDITRITGNNEACFAHVLNGTAVTATENMLRIGAVDDEGNGVAALSAYFDAQFIEVTSLYVQEKYRRQGYGRALMETLVSLAEDDYTSVTVYVYDDEGAEEFLKGMGFELFDATELHYIRLGEVLRSAYCRRLLLDNDTEEIKNISDLDENEIKILLGFFKKNHIPLKGGFDPHWSTIRFDGTEVADIYLVEPMNGDVNMILQSFDKKNPQKITMHMTELIRKMEEEAEFGPLARFNFASDNTKFLEALGRSMGSTAYINSAGKYKKAIRLL